jgi:two-component system cell cycle sensor histidine kinase/response regulator CckA
MLMGRDDAAPEVPEPTSVDATVAMLAVVREIADDVAAQLDQDRCFRRLRAGLLRLGFRRAGILESIPGDSSRLRGSWGTSFDGSELDEHELVLPLSRFVAFEAIARGDRIILRRVLVPTDLTPPIRSFEVVPEGPPNHACVALRADGQFIGIISVDMLPSNDSLGRYSLAALELLADLVATVIARERVATTLRRSERHFRLLIEWSTDIFAILNANGTIRYVSPSVTAALGCPPDEAVGASASDFVHPDDLPSVAQVLATIGRDPGGAHAIQMRCRHQNGSWRLFEAIGVNLLADPAISGIVATLRDITDRNRLEEQLRQAQKMEAIGLLAGGVAHDFNNLLTVINGYGELLVPSLTPNSFQIEAVRQILTAGQTAASLTRKLLAFSRRQVVTPEEVDLNGLVERLGAMLPRLIGEDIAVVTVLAPGLGLVSADPGQMEQVLLNLATNARDAMPRGGTLRIETVDVRVDDGAIPPIPDLAAGRYVMIGVSDNGVGMGQDIQARIFDPFFTTKEPGKGTGLGLAAVYGIVKQSGGSISVESEVGRGTSIRIFLPRISRPSEAPVSPVTPPVRPHGSETILVAEDSRPLRELARLTLERSGYTVLEAENGEAAIRIVESDDRPIHLLLTDVVMPGIGGRQAAEQILANRPTIKIVYMSGYTDDIVLRHGVVESGGAFLQKPFTTMALAQLIRTILDGGANVGSP